MVWFESVPFASHAVQSMGWFVTEINSNQDECESIPLYPSLKKKHVRSSQFPKQKWIYSFTLQWKFNQLASDMIVFFLYFFRILEKGPRHKNSSMAAACSHVRSITRLVLGVFLRDWSQRKWSNRWDVGTYSTPSRTANGRVILGGFPSDCSNCLKWWSTGKMLRNPSKTIWISTMT